MNQRIDELAQGCYEYIEGTLDGDVVEFDYKKFAELIVRECYGEVLCQLYDYHPSTNEQYNLGHEAGLKLAMAKMKEHFGVE